MLLLGNDGVSPTSLISVADMVAFVAIPENFLFCSIQFQVINFFDNQSLASEFEKTNTHTHLHTHSLSLIKANVLFFLRGNQTVWSIFLCYWSGNFDVSSIQNIRIIIIIFKTNGTSPKFFFSFCRWIKYFHIMFEEKLLHNS